MEPSLRSLRLYHHRPQLLNTGREGLAACPGQGQTPPKLSGASPLMPPHRARLPPPLAGRLRDCASVSQGAWGAQCPARAGRSRSPQRQHGEWGPRLCPSVPHRHPQCCPPIPSVPQTFSATPCRRSRTPRPLHTFPLRPPRGPLLARVSLLLRPAPSGSLCGSSPVSVPPSRPVCPPSPRLSSRSPFLWGVLGPCVTPSFPGTRSPPASSGRFAAVSWRTDNLAAAASLLPRPGPGPGRGAGLRASGFGVRGQEAPGVRAGTEARRDPRTGASGPRALLCPGAGGERQRGERLPSLGGPRRPDSEPSAGLGVGGVGAEAWKVPAAPTPRGGGPDRVRPPGVRSGGPGAPRALDGGLERPAARRAGWGAARQEESGACAG